MQKLFVVRKYIMAKSAQEAIKKDKAHPVDDVWISDEWHSKHIEIGFNEPKKKR